MTSCMIVSTVVLLYLFYTLCWDSYQPTVDYFGEKIGMYFLFLGYYTTRLIMPAVIGFFCWINVAADGNNMTVNTYFYYVSISSFKMPIFI